MKRIKVCLLLPVLMLASFVTISCGNLDSDGKGSGSLTLVIFGEGCATKASATDPQPYETVLNSLQILVFEGETLLRHENITEGLSTLPVSKTFSDLKAGAYQVYAVANAADLSGVASRTSFLATTVRLTDCGLTTSTGFVMCDGTTVTVTNGATASAALSLQRFCARVRLVSLTNNVPAGYAGGGAITVKGVFLINGKGTWNLGGTGAASEWINLGGRTSGNHASTGRADYIDAASDVNPSAYQGHVFHADGSSVARGTTRNYGTYFYTMPNEVTADHTGATSTPSTGAMSRLVVLATVNGADYWYPVTLFKDGKGPERNTAYDVTVTIKATGSEDPNEPVGKGNLTATVTVRDWLSGADYTEEI